MFIIIIGIIIVIIVVIIIYMYKPIYIYIIHIYIYIYAALRYETTPSETAPHASSKRERALWRGTCLDVTCCVLEAIGGTGMRSQMTNK